ncbi:MAG: hypothetical protein AAFW95_05725 [Cyanobacteria bacterium J06638_6]
MPNIQVNPDGSVIIDRNAFDLRTGELTNGSDIPLPDGLIENPREGVPQPVIDGQLAPNSVEMNADVDSINQQLDGKAQGFTIQPESLQLTTQFDLRHRPNNHAYAEGIQVTVYDSEGAVVNQQTAFVRGDRVTQGADGNPLPSSAQINIGYGANDIVELRVLNLRNDGAQPTDSGIYFTTQGEFAVEDQPDGGDLDFTDGDYLEVGNGRGQANIEREGESITETISYRTETVETSIDPLVREDQTIGTGNLQFEQDVEDVQEEREYGQVESADPDASLLPHALGATTEDNEQLIYSRYSDAGQIRLGSDGGSITGQFAPLTSDPAVPPTLINGTLRFDPGASNNQAGISATVGVTQFLHPTHQDAVDMYGNVIANPDGEGPRLLQATGLIQDTRLVGYVPEVPDQVIPGAKLQAVNGVFELPEDTAVVIEPLESDQAGRGDSAYTHNVGGLILESADGELTFIPQWTYEGYAKESIHLAAGQARRVIYALVPQQEGQNLQLGQRYSLKRTQNGYVVDISASASISSELDGPATDDAIAPRGFQVISADQHPENFQSESLGVYAVEDTLARQNAVTEEFNGVPGVYRYSPEAEPEATVDITQPEEVDARVGNIISLPDKLIPGTPGQSGYTTTTLAGGLYARGGLTLGLGNQEDTITTNTLRYKGQGDMAMTEVTTYLFATPRLQVDTLSTELLTRITEQTRQEGTATFDIDAEGLLNNIEIDLDPEQVISQFEETIEGNTEITSEILLGAEYLAGTTKAISTGDAVFGPFNLIDHQVGVRTDSYPNFSPLMGELALGSILNFGNTPWTPAANTIRGELFVRDTVIGQGDDGADVGWRTELVFNPFGEEQRPAFYYDPQGQAIPIYQTEPVFDAAGQPVYEEITTATGEVVAVATHQFILDETGEQIQQTVGTGVSLGPGFYLRLEDLFTDNNSISVIGGLKFDL